MTTGITTENTIPLTRMQAAAVYEAIEGRLFGMRLHEATERLGLQKGDIDTDALRALGRELDMIADVLECVAARRMPVDDEARLLLARLEMKAGADAEQAGDVNPDDRALVQAQATYLKVTREAADRAVGGGA